MPWPTFWTEPTGLADLGLRRYRWRDGDDVEAHFHNACRIIDRVPTRFDTEHRREGDRPDCFLASISASEFADHPWWPVQCACGEYFTPEDEWQVTQDPIYSAIDGRGEWPQDRLPVGAMFDACWPPEVWRNPVDGMAVTVVLPPDLPAGADSRGHYWNVDGPATHKEPTADGERSVLVPHAWTRTGDPKAIPPTISVTPSIDTGTYHSFLTAGVLGDG